MCCCCVIVVAGRQSDVAQAGLKLTCAEDDFEPSDPVSTSGVLGLVIQPSALHSWAGTLPILATFQASPTKCV